MKLSYHEKFLAVALKVFNEGNAKIEMFNLINEKNI